MIKRQCGLGSKLQSVMHNSAPKPFGTNGSSGQRHGQTGKLMCTSLRARLRAYAGMLLLESGALAPDGLEKMEAFDDALIARHLSPGGNADLLAVTWFLAQFPRCVGMDARSSGVFVYGGAAAGKSRLPAEIRK